MILKDDVEQFFDKITALDMMLQLKQNYPANTAHQNILEDYKAFLQKDVEDFTAEETANIESIFAKLYPVCKELAPSIIPKELKLIKTKGQHYGDGVYYTRENCIIIPKNELENFNPDAFAEVMLHELAHIYTRYHPKKRAALYRLIGFEKLNVSQNELLIPEELSKKILLNPDGIDYSYAVALKNETDSSFLSIPIISANTSGFQQEKPHFFEYLQFHLYPVREINNQGFQVLYEENDYPIINPYYRTDFLKQITDNTDYIIHPDEIIADNFKLLFLSKTRLPKYNRDRLSKEGQALLKAIEQVIAE